MNCTTLTTFSRYTCHTLAERLRRRGSESDTSLKTRLETATHEMKFAATNDVFHHIPVNCAYAELRAYVTLTLRPWAMQDAREHI